MLRADQEHAEASQDVFAAIDDAFLPALFRAVVGQRWSGRIPGQAAPRGRRRRAPILPVPAQPRQPSLLPSLPTREALVARHLAASGGGGLSMDYRRGWLWGRRR
jgi:hypothetical protein